MNRTAIREKAFQLIYSLEIQKCDNLNEQIELYYESENIENVEAKEYIEDAIWGIDKNQKEIIGLIEENLKSDWKIDRISKIDLSILKLAIYEIKFKEIPFKVVINEAVELAKAFGDTKSPNFINGVLASIVKKNNLNEGEKED